MIEKLEMQTKDLSQEKIRLIRELFPNCVTESRERERERTVLSVDFDALRQELSGSIVEGQQERYQFTWPDKSKAKHLANTPTTMTLRPCREESVDFDNTKNLYIEGDNLEVLKILRETYLGKVKMIYIDPPYNTGNDFVYNDDYSMSFDEYNRISNDMDEIGNRLITNSSSNGRFHTDWLNMIYPRLMIAKDLLSNNGVIFISLDDNEIDNLKKVCNEIFGERNFIECLIWKKRATPPNDKNIGRIHEYILVYAKDVDEVSLGLLPRDEKSISRYSNPDDDPRGPWVASDLSANGKGGRIVQSCIYPVINPTTGKEYYPSEGRCWLFNKEKMTSWINEGRIGFRDNTGAPFLKRYLKEVRQGLTLPTLLVDYGFSQTSAAEADKIFDAKGIFEYAKPTTLIKPLVMVGAPHDDDLILDFFSGSATTADSIIQLNAESGVNRRYILVQVPEKTDDNSSAHKNGYKTICDIGKDRIRRVGKRIKADCCSNNIDVGFRVFKCDSSNMKDTYYTPCDILSKSLDDYTDVIKSDRESEDLLIQVMLELGIELSSRIEQKNMHGHIIFSADDGYLVACFDDSIDDSTVIEISKEMSGCMYAVFRSGSSMSDEMLTNIEQIFKTYSPQTKIRIL